MPGNNPGGLIVPGYARIAREYPSLRPLCGLGESLQRSTLVQGLRVNACAIIATNRYNCENDPPNPMSTIEQWLALTHIEQLGAATLARLLATFGSPGAILTSGRTRLQASGLSDKVVEEILAPDAGAIERDLEWLQCDAHHLITLEDRSYPKLLKQIPDPPAVLYVLGDKEWVPQLLSRPQLAIIGSRNASGAGKQIAKVFAQELAQAGLVITSGLARGIDGAAHRGALQASLGTTIAVAACGLDRVYPADHLQLAERIAKRGAIVSEFAITTPPKPWRFAHRNRIVSGLSTGVLVVEASVKSGTMITARLAGEQGREVFAIPGTIHSPLSKGCHALIRQGAKLVETVEDILEELKNHSDPDDSLDHATHRQNDPARLEACQDPAHQRVLESMEFAPVSIDTLIERCGLDLQAVSSILLILELNGQVLRTGHGMYARSAPAI